MGSRLSPRVFPQSCARPIRQRVERIRLRSEAGEIERQFAAHDQLFQKFFRDQLVLLGVFLHRQRDFERRDMPEVQIRAQPRRRFFRRLIAGLRVAPQIVLQEIASVAARPPCALRETPPTGRPRGRSRIPPPASECLALRNAEEKRARPISSSPEPARPAAGIARGPCESSDGWCTPRTPAS